MQREDMAGKIIQHDGDVWRVLAVGATNEDGCTYCHLASMTRFRKQRNGLVALQIADWLPLAVLDQAPKTDFQAPAERSDQQ